MRGSSSSKTFPSSYLLSNTSCASGPAPTIPRTWEPLLIVYWPGMDTRWRNVGGCLSGMGSMVLFYVSLKRAKNLMAKLASQMMNDSASIILQCWSEYTERDRPTPSGEGRGGRARTDVAVLEAAQRRAGCSLKTETVRIVYVETGWLKTKSGSMCWKSILQAAPSTAEHIDIPVQQPETRPSMPVLHKTFMVS